MSESLPSNDDSNVKLLSVKRLLGDRQPDVQKMDEKNRLTQIESKIDQINKAVKQTQGVVNTTAVNRVATGARALSKGIKDNWNLFKSEYATDKLVGALNILEGISAAIPPPYNSVGAIFGIFSDVLQIIQDKPSEVELIQKMINDQTAELTRAIKNTEIKMKEDFAQKISGLIEGKAAGSIELAQQHLFNRDYLMYDGKLSDDKLTNIQKELDERTKLFGELKNAIKKYLGFADEEQKEIDDEKKERIKQEKKLNEDKQAVDKVEAEFKAIPTLEWVKAGTKFEDGDIFGGLWDGITGLWKGSITGEEQMKLVTNLVISDKLKDKKATVDEDKNDIDVTDTEIDKLKKLKLEYIAIATGLLNLYCNLSLLHHNIIYLLSYRLIARDEKDTGYLKFGDNKFSTDYDFLQKTTLLINTCIAQTGPERDGFHYQVYGDGHFTTDKWEDAVKRYNSVDLKWAKVMLCNGIVVAKYGIDKWTKIHTKDARKDFRVMNIYQLYCDNDLTLHERSKAEEAYENVSPKFAKVLACNGVVIQKYGTEKWQEIGIKSVETEFLKQVNVTKDTLQYLAICNVQNLMKSEAGDMDICSVDLSSINYQPRFVTVKVGDKEEECLEFVKFKKEYGSKYVWFNPVGTLIQ
eukprot:260713_1